MYIDSTRIAALDPKLAKPAPPTKWVFEVEPQSKLELEFQLSISITDVFYQDVVQDALFDGNAKCYDLLVLRRNSFDTTKSYCSADEINVKSMCTEVDDGSRRESLDTTKSYCSADGINAESMCTEVDDDSVESLSLHDIFDDCEDLSDDGMSVDTMIPNRTETVTFKNAKTSKPQVLPETDFTRNVKIQQKRPRTQKRKRTKDSSGALAPDSACTRQLPHHLRSLLFAFSLNCHDKSFSD